MPLKYFSWVFRLSKIVKCDKKFFLEDKFFDRGQENIFHELCL